MVHSLSAQLSLGGGKQFEAHPKEDGTVNMVLSLTRSLAPGEAQVPAGCWHSVVMVVMSVIVLIVVMVVLLGHITFNLRYVSHAITSHAAAASAAAAAAAVLTCAWSTGARSWSAGARSRTRHLSFSPHLTLSAAAFQHCYSDPNRHGTIPT